MSNCVKYRRQGNVSLTAARVSLFHRNFVNISFFDFDKYLKMSLLPKTRQDFTQTEYWNSFFQKRGKKSFEWYLL